MSESLGADGDLIWAAMRAVYAGFLAGTPDAVDGHLHPDVTIWDSAHVPLVRGLAGLARLRSARPPLEADGPQVVGIEATDPVVDVWGDVGLLRHVLRVRYSGEAPDEIVRNTSVWRREDGRWLAVHNHEDVTPS